MMGQVACSVKRSSSVSWANVVSRTPALVAPMPFAHASAMSRAFPEAFWDTAT